MLRNKEIADKPFVRVYNLSRIYSGSSGYHILLEHMAAAEINITNTRKINPITVSI